MKRSYSLGVLLLLLTATVPLLAFVDPPPPDPAELELNHRRLEKWRADPEHYQRLQRDLKAFWELPAEKRERLRQLDRLLHETDSFTQKRLWAVLERYSAWLERLPETDRQRLDAAERHERLTIIKEIKDRQWVERLPRAVRTQLDALAPEQRAARIAVLHKEDKERRLAWQRELRQLPRSIDRPTRLAEFPTDVQSYVKEVLRPMLNVVERRRLEQAEGADWPQLALTLLDLSEKHPLALPGPPTGPRTFAQLPQNVQNVMPFKDLEPQYKQRLLRSGVAGRWPEFAMEFTAIAREKGITLPVQLGPNRPIDFKPSLGGWVRETLLPRLSEGEREELTQAEGRWPDYPKKLLELSHKVNLDIPGMKLPGPKEFWDKARATLPEVPDHLLRDFVILELSPEERRNLQMSAADPEASRNRIREAYFKKKPDQLKRQRQLDIRVLTVPLGAQRSRGR